MDGCALPLKSSLDGGNSPESLINWNLGEAHSQHDFGLKFFLGEAQWKKTLYLTHLSIITLILAFSFIPGHPKKIRTYCPIPDLFRTIFGTLVRIRTKSGIPDHSGPTAEWMQSASSYLLQYNRMWHSTLDTFHLQKLTLLWVSASGHLPTGRN